MKYVSKDKCLDKLNKAKKQAESLPVGIRGYQITMLFGDNISPNEILKEINNIRKYTNADYSYIINEIVDTDKYGWNFYVELYFYNINNEDIKNEMENYIMSSGLTVDFNIKNFYHQLTILNSLNKHIKEFNYEEYQSFESKFKFVNVTGMIHNNLRRYE